MSACVISIKEILTRARGLDKFERGSSSRVDVRFFFFFFFKKGKNLNAAPYSCFGNCYVVIFIALRIVFVGCSRCPYHGYDTTYIPEQLGSFLFSGSRALRWPDPLSL